MATKIGLKVNQPPQDYPVSRISDPPINLSALTNPPLPPVRPADLGGAGLPLPPARPPDLGVSTNPAAPALDNFQLLRNTVGGSGGPQQMFTAANLGGLGQLLAQAMNPRRG